VKLIPPATFRRVGDTAAAPGGAPGLRATFPDLFRNPRVGESTKRLSIWLHVVNACNYACSYCYVPHLRRSVDPALVAAHSFDAVGIPAVLDNLLTYCRREQLTELHIVFAGGEPTLNLPLIDEFCRTAEQRDGTIRVTFGMISNGSFAADDVIPLLRKHRINVSLSVDGVEAFHDRIRFERDENGRRVGSWSTVVANIDHLRDSGHAPYLLHTVTPSNFVGLQAFAAFARERELGFRLSLVRTHAPIAREVQAEVGEAITALYRSLGETLSPKLPIPRFAAFAEWDLYRKKYLPCSSCRNYFAVGANGEVASCQMRMNEAHGNVRTQSFDSIVSRLRAAPGTKTLSDPQSRHGACVECEYFHVCAGGCPQHTAMALGNMDQPSPWCSVFGTVIPHYLRAVARQLQRAVTPICV
jgi:uncharacterized protein